MRWWIASCCFWSWTYSFFFVLGNLILDEFVARSIFWIFSIRLSLYVNDILISLLASNSLSCRAAWHVLVHLPEHWIDLHLGSFDNLVCHSFLHEIDLTLPDDLHELVLQWDSQFVRIGPSRGSRIGSFQILDAFHTTTLHYSRPFLLMLGTWIHQKRIILARETNISCKMRLIQTNTGIRLHLQQVILILPYKRNIFEFLKIVSLWRIAHHVLDRSWLRIIVGQQEVIYELLSPFYDALDDVQAKHSQ